MAGIDGFYKVMQRTHIHYKTAMVIPQSFYDKHATELDDGVLLQHKTGGPVWSAKVTETAESHQISGGWKRFVDDNKLQIDEIVVFRVPEDRQQTPGEPLLLKFQVFDAVDGVEKPPVTLRTSTRKRRSGPSASKASSSSSGSAGTLSITESL